MAHLEISDLEVRYGAAPVLSGIDLAVERGELVGLVGPSGSGKSTLLRALVGLVPPAAGRVVLEGKDVNYANKASLRGLRDHAAIVFQQYNLFQNMSVLDNIKLGGHTRLNTNPLTALWYRGPAQREEMALRSEIERDVIDFLEIDHIRHLPVAGLAYGLQKRVELARALAMRPKVLMLDEPVAGMNREETEDMARFILDIQEERGITVLLIEHDMGLVMDISHHVVVLNFGQVIGQGTPAQVRANPEVVRAYLGDEATRRVTQ
jgi:branched-chain amino acid transport system ATP-binding protein